MRIGILGATGFIGSHLLKYVASKGIDCVAFSRKSIKDNSEQVSWVKIDQSSNQDDFGWLDQGVDVLIDCAGPADISCNEKVLKDLFSSHIASKKNIFMHCAALGVKHYVYVSSVKVYGEISESGPFDEFSVPNPGSCYGEMKLEIENALRIQAGSTTTVLSILRLPMVYSDMESQSLLRLKSYLKKGLPLPFLDVGNFRSILSTDNLSSFLFSLVSHSVQKSEIWLVSDEVPVSTTSLVETFAVYHNLKPRLFYMPKVLMKMILILLGKKALYQKLYCDLVVNDAFSRRKLDWHPQSSGDAFK